MKNLFKWLIFIVAVSALLFTAACAKKDLNTTVKVKDTNVTTQTSKDDSITEEDLYGKTPAEARINFMNEDVLFEFDSYTITPEYEDILRKKVKWLMNNSSLSMTIEGHCDSRGTSAYNFALGDKRANNVKQFLLDSGIAAYRIDTVSFGEEKPLDPRENAEAWRKNRRAHFVLK